MDAINRQKVRARITFIYDVLAGAQGQPKDTDKYVSALQKAVGILEERNDSAAFLARNRGGI